MDNRFTFELEMELVLFKPKLEAIPWHGDVEPFGKKSCKCSICNLIVEKGICVGDSHSR